MKDRFEMSFDFKMPTAKAIKKAGAEKSAAVKAFQKAHLQSSTQVVEELTPLLNTALTANIWEWPRDTNRKNGGVAGTIRDITDLGTLARSLNIQNKFLQTKSVTKIQYTAPHARMVYYGGAIQPYGNKSAATVFVPGRPWIESVLRGENGLPKYDIYKVYEQNMARAWSELS